MQTNIIRLIMLFGRHNSHMELELLMVFNFKRSFNILGVGTV
jgi:hypothetical protein